MQWVWSQLLDLPHILQLPLVVVATRNPALSLLDSPFVVGTPEVIVTGGASISTAAVVPALPPATPPLAGSSNYRVFPLSLR